MILVSRRAPLSKAALPDDERDPEVGGHEAKVGQIIYSAILWLARTVPDDLGAGTSVEEFGRGIDWMEFSERFTDVRDPLRKVVLQAGRDEVKQMRTTIRKAAGDVAVGTAVEEVVVDGAFEVIDQAAVAFAEQLAGQLVVEISDGIRAAIADLAMQATLGDLTGAQLARKLRSVVGLHAAWRAAVDKTYDRTLAAALADGKTTVARATMLATKASEAKAKALLNRRAWNIARTETQRAQNLGKYAGWQEQVSAGWVAPDSLKEWEEGRDPCDTCAPLVGQIVRWDEPFSNGMLMPPDHPSCRCTANMLPPDDEFVATMNEQRAARELAAAA